MKKISLILLSVMAFLIILSSCAPADSNEELDMIGANINISENDEVKLLNSNYSLEKALNDNCLVYADRELQGEKDVRVGFVASAIAKENASYRTTYFDSGKLTEYTDVIAGKDGFTFNVYKVGDLKTENTKSLEFACFKEVKLYTLSEGAETYTKFYMLAKDKDTTYADYRAHLGAAYSSSEDNSANIPCLNEKNFSPPSNIVVIPAAPPY